MSPAGEVVVSGLGLLSAPGRGVERFWRALCDGGTPADGRGDPRVGAPVSTEPAPRPGERRAAFAAAAAADALDDAALPGLPDGGLVVVAGQAAPMPEAAGDPSWCDFTGATEMVLPGIPPSATVVHLSHACATAGFGLAVARDWLVAGLVPAAIVVGGCAANDHEHASMDVVRALSPTGARPFSPDRDGTTIGEGGGAIVLETRAAADRRGAAPGPVLAGVGHRVGGEGKAGTDVDRAAGVMDDALDEARTGTVDHVQAHATGTVQGDEAELVALERVAAARSWRDVPVSSAKGSVGHMLHTSVVAGVVAAARVLAEGVVPPTAGLAEERHRGPLRLPVPAERVGPARAVLVNGFGFGGNNVSIVLRAPGGG